MADLHKIKEAAGIFGKGMLLQMVPNVAAGLINQMFHQWNIDVGKVTEQINSNTSLWSQLAPEYQDELRGLAEKVDLDFITPAFFINSIKKDFPGVASLFVNWPEAADWLGRQIVELQAAIKAIPPS
jgi:hypothetical protein